MRDVRKKLPFDNNSIDYIYSSHLIEHLRRDEAEKLMRECFRVLKNGGMIRLSVPDLEVMVRNYIKEIEDIRQNKKKKDYIPSERFLVTMDLGAEKTKTPIIQKIFSYNQHKWMYDELSLTMLLTSCGFVDIKKRSYKIGKVPDIEFLDNRSGLSLYLEGYKPKGRYNEKI